jgi:anti-sigma28 factor (negative regulator of flagellin synthesis)
MATNLSQRDCPGTISLVKAVHQIADLSVEAREKAPDLALSMDRSEAFVFGLRVWEDQSMDTIALPESAASPEEFALQKRYFRPDNFMNNVDLEKLENLKKAVGAGTYDVRAEEVAGKLIDYMLQLSNRSSLLDPGSFPANSVQHTSKTESAISVDNLKPTG